MSFFARPARIHLVAFAFYALVAVLVTYPLITVMSIRYAGFGYSDAYEMAHHLWWFKYAIQHGEPLFYQPLLAYPVGIEGIALWADPLQFFPAWALAFVMPLPLAYNLTLLLTMALNGLAMYGLALYLTERRYIPSLLAGLVFMLFPTMQGHLAAGHAGLMVQWTLPLYVYALLRLRAAPSRRWFALTALLFVVAVWGHTLQLIYAVVPVTGMVVLALLVRRDWRALGRVVLASVLGMILLVLFLLPIVQATLGTSAYTDEGGGVRYSADLLAFATPSFFHPLFGSLEYTHRVLGVNLDEGAAYLGVVAGVLALIAVWKIRASRWWLALALVAYGLALGPLLKVFDQPVQVSIGGYDTFITLPWAALESLPLFSLARTPGRFNFVFALAGAALAGVGASYLWARLQRVPQPRAALFIALMALIAFEYQTFFPLPSIDGIVPEPIAALSARDDVRAVLNVPWDNLVAAKEGLWLQTGHERAMIAGHVTRRTPVDPAMLTLLEYTLDPALLNEAGADIVIVHREHDPDDTLQDRARAELGEPLYENERFAVFETPDTNALPEIVTLASDETSITDHADSYLYTRDTGWITFSARVDAEGRDAVLLLDGEPIHRWTINGAQEISLPVPVGRYNTLTLAVDPPCPQVYSVEFRCRSLDVQVLEVDELPPALPSRVPSTTRFERGIEIRRSRLPATANAGEPLDVALYWRFSEPRADTDIRFVHVLDEAGTLVAQSDVTLGTRIAGELYVEAVSIPLRDDLAPGEYHVVTGWYTYPDLTRFCVIQDSSCPPDRQVVLGTVTVSE